MSCIRHTAVAADLKSRILRRTLVRILPSERDLAGEFHCARQTVREALALLAAERLIECRPGAKARIVPPRRRAARSVGLVSTGPPEFLRARPGIAALEREMAADGFRLEVLQVRERFSAPGASSFPPRGVAGLMFVYSTLTVEIANGLAASGVPFVSGNRLPPLSFLHYVEWDNLTALRRITAALTARGYRRIGLFFPGALENYAELSRRLWRELKTEFGLPPVAADDFRVDWSLPLGSKLKRLRTFLQGAAEVPEAMIFWNSLPAGYRAAPDMLHCYAAGGASNERMVGVPYRMAEGCGETLFPALYQALREVIWFAPRHPIRRLVPMEIELLQEIPPAEKRFRKSR